MELSDHSAPGTCSDYSLEKPSHFVTLKLFSIKYPLLDLAPAVRESQRDVHREQAQN
jgi:hypothetical protein